MKNDIWAATMQPPTDEAEPVPQRSQLLDAKVMMVDDEPLMTELIQTHLEDEGYANFVSTNDPREAMALLRSERPGVLLLDLMMPQMSGFDLLERIRADHELRFTPVIVLTASTSPESKLRVLQLGATDFLSKPVDASELVLRLRNTLAFQQYHERQLNYDIVTGLPNERLFDKVIDEVASRRRSDDKLVALFSLSVPECRRLREAVGQAATDELVRELARRLVRFSAQIHADPARAMSGERAPRVARLSVDQFGLLIEGLRHAEGIETLARELLQALSEPVQVGKLAVVPNPALGIAVSPADGHTADSLRKNAGLAASHVPEQGAARYQFSSPELNARSFQRLTLSVQLRGAAQRGELRVHYQPKVDFITGRIAGAEALVRWQHPDHGLMPPGLFIPLAEEIGLIGAIGEWVLEQACRDAAAWSRAGHKHLKMAVNVAKPQFLSDDLCGSLRRAVFDSGVPPEQLVIELTESMLIDDVRAGIERMHALKALGVTLSIDDFGTGYSSLSYLTRFPIDELKIDRSFITQLTSSHSDAAVVRTVIDLGHRLGMQVTAEGVETEGQLASLKALGCNQYQGFYFSRPVPSVQFLSLLARETAGASALS